MIRLKDWLKDIRIEDRVYESGALLSAWVQISNMAKKWYGNRPHKVMVF